MGTVPVLLYHSVSDRTDRGGARWTVAPQAFAAHIEAIASAGCTALTVTQLGACLRGDRSLPARPVAVTFDDGYADVVDAVAALAARDLSSTIFVSTGRIGRGGMVSRQALAGVAEMPRTEIGAHGVRHQRLDELSGAPLEHEVRGSRAQLEDLLQAPVTSFAYPHGAYDRRARAAVVDAGYAAAAAVKNALSHSGDDPFAIARWTVTAATRPAQIRALLDGHGAPVAWRRERIRTRASRAARRLKRRTGARPG